MDSNVQKLIDDIHLDHKNLLSVLADLSSGLSANDLTLFGIQNIFKQLANFCATHFTNEQKLIKEAKIYTIHPDMHLKTHNKFMQEISKICEDVTADIDKAGSLLGYLIYWIDVHVLNEDKILISQARLIQDGYTPQEAYNITLSSPDDHSNSLVRSINLLMETILKKNSDLVTQNRKLLKQISSLEQELSMKSRKLNDIPLSDEATGLPNRRFALRTIEALLNDAKINSSSIAVILAKINDFDKILEDYGLETAKELALMCSKTIENSLRNDDVVCKLNSNEFLIICPNTASQGAINIANIVLEKISTKVFVSTNLNKSINLNLTLTAAIALSNDRTSAAKELIREADRKLKAKNVKKGSITI